MRAEAQRRALERLAGQTRLETNATIEASRERCRDFVQFIREAWHVVEPVDAFVHGRHLDVVAAHLRAVIDGTFIALGYSNRLLFNVPPGTMKSLMIAVFWQAYEWGPLGRQHIRFLSSSYDLQLVNRDTRKTRDLIESEWFQARWPLTMSRRAEASFANESTGNREGRAYVALTGGRGHRVVIDDPHSTTKADSELLRKKAMRITRESLTSRMNDPITSAIVVMMQRLHSQDVSGQLLSLQLGYIHVMLPMEFEPDRCCYTPLPNPAFPEPQRMRYMASHQMWLPDDWEPVSDRDRAFEEEFKHARTETVYRWDWRTEPGELLFPERFPRDVVERDKKAMGSYAVAGQFQQRPAPRDGGIFKRSMFDFARPGEVPADCDWVRHWDLAATKKRENNNPAWTVGLKLGRGREDKRWYIRHVARDRLEAGKVRELILTTAEQDYAEHGRNVEVSLPIDPGQAGKGQAADMVAMLAAFRVHAERETGDKMVRAEPVISQAEAGAISIVINDDGSIPPWVEPLLQELEMVPAGFLDQLDALSGAYTRLLTKPSGRIRFGTVGGHR